MGKGRDLTKNERTIVGLKIKDFWNKDKNQIQHGAIVKIINECAASGVTCCKTTIKSIAQEMRNQQHLNDLVFQETGQVSGISFSPNKKGKVGRITKLTAEVKEAYRAIVTTHLTSIWMISVSFRPLNMLLAKFALIVPIV